MFKRRNCDRKLQLYGILTEPLNPRAVQPPYIAAHIVNRTIRSIKGAGSLYIKYILKS